MGSILGPLLVLVDITDLSGGISSNEKLFADDTFLFSVIDSVDTSVNELNNDLYQIIKLNGLYHGKRALTQTQVNRPPKKLFLVEKLSNFSSFVTF